MPESPISCHDTYTIEFDVLSEPNTNGSFLVARREFSTYQQNKHEFRTPGYVPDELFDARESCLNSANKLSEMIGFPAHPAKQLLRLTGITSVQVTKSFRYQVKDY